MSIMQLQTDYVISDVCPLSSWPSTQIFIDVNWLLESTWLRSAVLTSPFVLLLCV